MPLLVVDGLSRRGSRYGRYERGWGGPVSALEVEASESLQRLEASLEESEPEELV